MGKAIKTPDGRVHKFLNTNDAEKFIDGFNSCLHCYGEWQDNRQHIGPLATPIDTIILKVHDLRDSE